MDALDSGEYVRVYFPDTYMADEERVRIGSEIVGWRNGKNEFVIVYIAPDASQVLEHFASVLPTETDASTLVSSPSAASTPVSEEARAARDSSARDLANLHGLFRKLQVIGIVMSESQYMEKRGLPHGYQIGLCRDRSQPGRPVFLGPRADTAVFVVGHRPPRLYQMQFLSVQPMKLDLLTEEEAVKATENVEQKRHTRLLIDKVEQHVSERSRILHSKAPKYTEVLLKQLNHGYMLCFEMMQIEKQLGLARTNGSGSGGGTSSNGGVGNRRGSDASWVVLDKVSRIVTGVYMALLGLVFVFCRVVAEVVLWLLDRRWFFTHGPSLKDLFASAQQVDIRLQQSCYWPMQGLNVQAKSFELFTLPVYDPAGYIRFYNSLWLVANDVIIGMALGTWILENVDVVAHSLFWACELFTVQVVEQSLRWLMKWPAGFKLNNELASFTGDLFLGLIAIWRTALHACAPMFPVLVALVGYSGFAGASLTISIASDLLSIFTMHVYIFYATSAWLYNWQLNILVSLFHLFRGRKRNVLRKRIDSSDYDLDQLLLGTILFTLFAFLFSTVMVFYFNFALARVGVIAVKIVLDTMLAFLNHFPLFAIMLRIKDPCRLPGGISYVVTGSGGLDVTATRSAVASDDTQAPFSAEKPASRRRATRSQGQGVPSLHATSNTTTFARLKSTPLPLAALFRQYLKLAERLRKFYFSKRVMRAFARGVIVPAIPRELLYDLQYSMLPAKRISLGHLWQLYIRPLRKAIYYRQSQPPT